MPGDDAPIGRRFKWLQSGNGMTNWTTTYDTMWLNTDNIACNQSYTLTDKSIYTVGCGLTCANAGVSYYYEVRFIAGYGTYSGGTWSSQSSVTGTPAQTNCM
jgi:hypothetical protein